MGELLEGVVVVALRCVTHMNYDVYISLSSQILSYM